MSSFSDWLTSFLPPAAGKDKVFDQTVAATQKISSVAKTALNEKVEYENKVKSAFGKECDADKDGVTCITELINKVKDYEKLQDLLKVNAKELTDALQEKTKLEQQKATLNNEIRNLEAQIQTLESAASSGGNLDANIKREKDEAIKEKEAAESELQQTNTQLQAKDDELAQLRADTENLKQQRDKYYQELKTCKTNSRSLQEQTKSVKTDLKNARIQELSNLIDLADGVINAAIAAGLKDDPETKALDKQRQEWNDAKNALQAAPIEA